MRLYPLTDFPQRFRPGLTVFLEHPPHSGQGKWVRVQRVRPLRGNMLVIALEGIDGRQQAEALRSALLKVRREDRHPLPADTFYVDDLVGLPVYTAEGRLLGRVVDVYNGPANDALIVAAGEKESLIPLVRRFVAVDLPARRITVDPIPGMVDELLEGRVD